MADPQFLPGMDPNPPQLIPGTTKLSPEQMQLNRNGLAMVRNILSRNAAFRQGTLPAAPPPKPPPCLGC